MYMIMNIQAHIIVITISPSERMVVGRVERSLIQGCINWSTPLIKSRKQLMAAHHKYYRFCAYNRLFFFIRDDSNRWSN